MIKTVLKEINRAPVLFDELVKAQQENTKLKETIRLLEHLVDLYKPEAPPVPLDVAMDMLVRNIKNRAQEFCLDNPRLLGAELVIETAMFLGASIALGSEISPTVKTFELDGYKYNCPVR